MHKLKIHMLEMKVLICIKEYYKKELRFFVHTEARCWYRKICPCFCGVTVFCYWYNFSNLGRRESSNKREMTVVELEFFEKKYTILLLNSIVGVGTCK